MMRILSLLLSTFLFDCSALVGTKFAIPHNIENGKVINGATYKIQAVFLDQWTILGLGIPLIPFYKKYKPIEIFIEVERSTASPPEILIDGNKKSHKNIVNYQNVMTYRFEVENGPFKSIEILVDGKKYPITFDKKRSWFYTPFLTV